MLKCWSSTHTGRPMSSGHEPDHLPVAGDERELAPDHVDDVGVRGAGPSKIPMAAMCMWLTSSSTCRNDASSGLNRSKLTVHLLSSCRRLQHTAQAALTGGSCPIRRGAGGRPDGRPGGAVHQAVGDGARVTVPDGAGRFPAGPRARRERATDDHGGGRSHVRRAGRMSRLRHPSQSRRRLLRHALWRLSSSAPIPRPPS